MDAAEITRHLMVALAVIVAAAHACGLLAERIGQPRVLGEITAGLLLGPSFLGAVWPGAVDRLFPAELLPVLAQLAQLGLILFMFIVGLELDLDHLRGQGHRAVVISHSSIIVPFALGAALGWVLHGTVGEGTPRGAFALFVGAAMAVTAFPVLARILHDTGLRHHRVGSMALACAAVDDVTAWCILAVVLAVAGGTGGGIVLATIGLAAAFGAAMWFGVRPLLARLGRVPVPLALGLALVSAWATDVIGIHAIFGAFMAGAVVPRAHGERLFVEHGLEPLVYTLLLPVFFVVVGLSTEVGLVDTPELWAIAAAVLLVAVVGKLVGAGVAARVVGEGRRDALTLGVLMNTRGLTEIVILTVGLEQGIIGPTMFTIMVMMALVTTYMAVPVLARVVPGGLPGRAGGRARAGRQVGPAA